MQFKDFVLKFGEEAQKLITYVEQFKQLTGEQKKERVVDLLSDWVEATIDKVKINIVVKILIKNMIVSILPPLVQVAFNLIKAKVDGITK